MVYRMGKGEREMWKYAFLLLIASFLIISLSILTMLTEADPGPVTVYYGDIVLSGGFQSGHFDDVRAAYWDLTECDMVISFIYDANGLVDDSGCHAWAELGVRTVGYGDFNPTWMSEGAGIWLATDYDWTEDTFNPDVTPTLDPDDKLILQKGGGWDESTYNLPSSPPDPYTNYGIWFDRDGVDPWQATYWGSIDGATYNTSGIYHVEIRLHATSDISGEAYMTINGVSQGFYVGGWKNDQPEIYPAGMTFTGDMTKMQVFYGLYGYGATHTVAFKDITVIGCPVPPVGGIWTPLKPAGSLATWVLIALLAIAVIAAATKSFLYKSPLITSKT